jgi:hypothetical protein
MGELDLLFLLNMSNLTSAFPGIAILPASGLLGGGRAFRVGEVSPCA